MSKIAVLGFGTVGSGVAEVLTMNAGTIAERAGEPLELKYIVDVRDFPGSPYEQYLVHDFAVVENDPEVDVVAECIGGAGIAFEFVRRSLQAGKSVVTSNKELIATRGFELLQIAKEKKVSLLFEAAVGGGIPLLRPLFRCLAANEYSEVYGILNGTTNYILTQMRQAGQSFTEALADAQKLGYAEADPTADVAGLDACRKICILADLCFGHNVPVDWVHTVGITGITPEDDAWAAANGYAIKLLGRTFRREDGRITAYVSPHLVPGNSLIANVNGVVNGAVVRGNAVGEVFLSGPGAGKLPTASAVCGDLVEAVRHKNDRKYLTWEAEAPDRFAPFEELTCCWYVRNASGCKIIGPCTCAEAAPETAMSVFPVLEA